MLRRLVVGSAVYSMARPYELTCRRVARSLHVQGEINGGKATIFCYRASSPVRVLLRTRKNEAQSKKKKRKDRCDAEVVSLKRAQLIWHRVRSNEVLSSFLFFSLQLLWLL